MVHFDYAHDEWNLASIRLISSMISNNKYIFKLSNVGDLKLGLGLHQLYIANNGFGTVEWNVGILRNISNGLACIWMVIFQPMPSNLGWEPCCVHGAEKLYISTSSAQICKNGRRRMWHLVWTPMYGKLVFGIVDSIYGGNKGVLEVYAPLTFTTFAFILVLLSLTLLRI